MNNQTQTMNQSQQMVNQMTMSQQSHLMSMNQHRRSQNERFKAHHMMMNNRGGRGGGGSGESHYGLWPAPLVQQNFPAFVSSQPPMGRNNWKIQKGININKNDFKKKAKSGGYNSATLKKLQQENRLKERKPFQKKKFDKFHKRRSAPFAPRNTSSFIIRAKKSGGMASLISPCPFTPAVLPTPIFSPSKEVLVDMAKEEWGVDGYGSMKGLIRLRTSPGNEGDVGVAEDVEEEGGGGSSESDMEEHLEVERRLDHDLSRFEMIYPGNGGAYNNVNVLENRVDDQYTHIAQAEEENLILKERLFLMERELGDLRRRLYSLERRCQGEEIIDKVEENWSENESGSVENSRTPGNDGGEEYNISDVEVKGGNSIENDNGGIEIKEGNNQEAMES